MSLRKEEILRKIRENREKIDEYGVTKMGIFGSAARDEITEKSDILILL
ncbi:MAG: nucleotidyltransferase domain-containing protein [Candidatus Helarchaeota archaeon]